MIRALFLMSLVALPLAGLGAEATQSRSACPATEAIRAEPARDPNADPFGFGPWYINADRTIWAGWDAVRMVAGPKGNKVLWIRPQGTQLTVSGRRLDSDAAPAEARIPCCYPTGFQASGLAFPTEGCWKISAKAGTSELTFVTRVIPEPPALAGTLDLPYDGFMFKPVAERIRIFNQVSPESRADLVRTHLARWLGRNAPRLTDEQKEVMKENLAFITADRYREPKKAEDQALAKALGDKTAKLFSREDAVQALTIQGDYIPPTEKK